MLSRPKLILLTPTTTDQNTIEQREERPRQKASVRLPAQYKRQYADCNRCRLHTDGINRTRAGFLFRQKNDAA
jgi:hypothetical protein